MNLEMFNQEKADPAKIVTGIYVNKDAESECVRLSNELRNKAAFTTLTGKVIPATTDGFDIETASFGIIRQWLNDESKKKSPSLFCFVHRVLSVRFPTEHQAMKVHRDFEEEKKLIDEKKKNLPSWFGAVGYSGKITLSKKTMKWMPILYG